MPRTSHSFLVAFLFTMPLYAQRVEHDDALRSPLGEPLAAWHTARDFLGDNVEIRSLSLAHFGMFVFYTPHDHLEIRAIHLDPGEDDFPVEDDGSRAPDLCSVPGIAPEQVETGLRHLLQSTAWEDHQPRLDGLFLSCRDALHWEYSQPPEGGYPAGMPITFSESPLDLTPLPLPVLEREE